MNEVLRKHILRLTFVLAIIVCILWFYFDHNWHPFINVFAFALGYFASIEGKSVDLAGIWSYKVIRSGKILGHAGRCELIQKGNSVAIHGHRYISSQRNGAVSDVDWIWKSDFGYICTDGVLRFEYFINTAGGTKAERLTGFCRVVISHDGRKLDGDYSKLPPFEDNSENTEWGTIVFRKLAKGAMLERPHHGYDKVGNERRSLTRPGH